MFLSFCTEITKGGWGDIIKKYVEVQLNVNWFCWGILDLFQGTPISSTDKTDRHDIAEILLKVALIKHHNSNPYQETPGSVFLSVHI